MGTRRKGILALGMLLLWGAFFQPQAARGEDAELRALKARLAEMAAELQQVQERVRMLEAREAAAQGPEHREFVPDRTGVGLAAGKASDLTFSGQVRLRYERRGNPGLDAAAHADEDVVLLRTRVGLLARLTPDAALRVEFQDSRLFGEETSTASDEGGVDLKQGVLEVTGLGERGVLDLHLGRQVLSYGDQKILGAFEWSNTGRSFDAARLVFHSPGARWRGDLFGAVLDEEFGGDDDETLWGFYNTFALQEGGSHTLDAYLLLRRDGNGAAFPGGGALEEYTLGVRAAGTPGRWKYAFEGVYQFGDRGDLDIRAYALHGRLVRLLPGGWKPEVLLEANLGTGDDDPNDGTWKRFDNLFPTNHLHYGYADLFSWTNLQHWRLGLAFAPTVSSRLALDFHRFALETTADAWFNAGGKVVRAASPGADADAGWEADLTWSYRWEWGLGLLLGCSAYHPGDFAEATGPADSFQFFYVQAVMGF